MESIMSLISTYWGVVTSIIAVASAGQLLHHHKWITKLLL